MFFVVPFTLPGGPVYSSGRSCLLFQNLNRTKEKLNRTAQKSKQDHEEHQDHAKTEQGNRRQFVMMSDATAVRVISGDGDDDDDDDGDDGHEANP